METQTGTEKKNNSDILKVVGLILLFGILIFAVARVIIGSSFFRESGEVLHTDTDGDILYSAAADAIAGIRPYESGIAVLTESEMLYFDAAGSITRSARHDYQTPCLTSFERKILVYDRGKTDYRIEINAAVYGEWTAPGDILTAAVGKSGNYAIATLADGGFQSKLYVYKQDGTLQFEWGCAKNFITGIALSDDGKHFAVAVAGSENAVYASEIQCFTIGVQEAVYTENIPNTTVLALDYMHSDTLCYVTDSFVCFVTNGIAERKLSYSPSSLLDVDIVHASDVYILLSSGFVDETAPQVYAWNHRGDCTLASFRAAQAAELITAQGRYFAVADEKNMTVYTAAGAFAGEAKSIYAIADLQVVGSNVFYLHENGFSVFSVHNRLAQTTEPAA